MSRIVNSGEAGGPSIPILSILILWISLSWSLPGLAGADPAEEAAKTTKATEPALATETAEASGSADYSGNAVSAVTAETSGAVSAEQGQPVPAEDPAAPAHGSQTWINTQRWNLLVIGILLVGAVLLGIRSGRRGAAAKVRMLPGIAALEEAIGNAAATGQPIFYCPGSEDLSEMQTITSLSVLEQVTALGAPLEVDLRVPHFHSLVMAAAEDTLRQSYAKAGRSADFAPDRNYYVSDEQFGYVAGVSGQMCRQKPAVCLYFGSFYAEGLALAEVGQTIGAVQIAGTSERAQLPFLLTACDHVLIGEEMFAAPVYLSRDPGQLGGLRGQDFGKLIAAVGIGLGCLLATVAAVSDSGLWAGLRDGMLSLFAPGGGR